MASYTQLSHTEIKALADQYGLTVTESEPLDGGNGNSSYLLKTRQATYVLTVCDDKAFDEVNHMGQLLLLLEQHNVPCNRLISPVNGGILLTLPASGGDKAVMLKGYIEGQVVENLTEQQLFEVGRQAAKLNQIPPPDYLPTHHPYGRKLFPKVLGLNIDSDYETLITQELDYLAQNISAGLPRGLIHGDLFYDNLLMQGDAFKAIIDFEEACHYYCVFELGMAIVGACVDDANVEANGVDLTKARALVAGYQQVRPLKTIEQQSLQMFVRYAAMATSYWRFKTYNIEKPNNNKATHHWQMVRLAQAVAGIEQNRFFTAIFG